MDINVLVNITAKAWSLPILAALHDGVVGRQAPLLAATGANRTSFAQSLGHLIEIGLVERNPGYGHPLRPEFRLTETGQEAAAFAHRIYKKEEPLLRRSWTVPVLATLDQPQHFSGIRKRLVRITDRALSQSLKSMEKSGWIARDISQEMWPPRPLYRAVNAGGALSKVIAPVVSFGVTPETATVPV